MPNPPQIYEPVRELIAGWQADEERMSGEFTATFAALEQLVQELVAAGDRVGQHAASREAEVQQQLGEWQQQQESEQQHRKRLEHDLALSRSRVTELERHLQQRTEELLEAQSANNALAAQLQEITDPLPVIADHGDTGQEADHAPAPAPAVEQPAVAEGESSVSERFARLRSKSA